MNKNFKKVAVILIVALGVTLGGGVVALASGRGGGSISSFSLEQNTDGE